MPSCCAEFYDESLRPERLKDGAFTVLSWNVASLRTLITGTKTGQVSSGPAVDAELLQRHSTGDRSCAQDADVLANLVKAQAADVLVLQVNGVPSDILSERTPAPG